MTMTKVYRVLEKINKRNDEPWGYLRVYADGSMGYYSGDNLPIAFYPSLTDFLLDNSEFLPEDVNND